MYLLICQTLEIRPVPYPFINQGTHSFSGRGIKFLLKMRTHCSWGEPQRGPLPLPFNICIHNFQSECKGFLSLDLPCVGVNSPIYFSDFKDYYFLTNFYLSMSGFNSASFTSSNYVISFLLKNLIVSNLIWVYSFLNILFRPQVAISSQLKSDNTLKIMSFTLGNRQRIAITTDSQYETSKRCMPSFF